MSRFDDPEILRGVLEDLPTGVYLVGRDGKILFWNYGAERITGHLRQDVVGHACREDFLGNSEGKDDQVSAASVALDAVLKDGKSTESQVSFRHKAGHLVPVRLRAIAMRDQQGAIIGVAECFDELWTRPSGTAGTTSSLSMAAWTPPRACSPTKWSRRVCANVWRPMRRSQFPSASFASPLTTWKM
jgi:PAS domain S-box-containing protein